MTTLFPGISPARESDERFIAPANEVAAGKYDDMLDHRGREAEANLPPGYRFDREKGEAVRHDPAPADQPIPIDRSQP